MNVYPRPKVRDIIPRILPALFLLLAVLGLCAGFCMPGIGAEPATGHWMTVQSTAYCPCPVCCGERAAGLTADGTDVGKSPYGIAAHPHYLPYGSLVYVPAGYGYLDRSRADRFFRVDDTGGIIRRRSEQTEDLWIDLRFRSHASAKAWGVRTISIFVLDQTNN